MKFCVDKFGRPAADSYSALAEMYQKRLKPIFPIDSNILRVNDQTIQTAYSDFLRKLADVSAKTQKQQILVCLDEGGKQVTSEVLAAKVREWQDDARIGTVHFAIGGSFGFSEEMKKAAHWKWGLSSLTLQGDLAWVTLWEQLYRAVMIIKNHPYHHS